MAHPTTHEYARAFFEEAARDLGDAYILHAQQRWAAAVTSSMHAVEKALKSHLILGGGTPWMRLEHRVYERCGGSNDRHFLAPLWYPIRQAGLDSDITILEDLTPDREGASNPEYPFLELTPRSLGPPPTPPVATLRRPETYFDASRSLDLYAGAHRVVTFVQGLHTEFQSPPVALPLATFPPPPVRLTIRCDAGVTEVLLANVPPATAAVEIHWRADGTPASQLILVVTPPFLPAVVPFPSGPHGMAWAVALLPDSVMLSEPVKV